MGAVTRETYGGFETGWVMTMLAVVPIFMGAGAALMPTIIAAVASVAAVILKPRELVRVIRERPVASAGTVVAVALLVAGGMWWFGGSRTAKAAVAGGTDMHGRSRIDWAKVAEELITRQQAGMTGAGGTGSGGGGGATTQISTTLVTGCGGAVKAGGGAWIEAMMWRGRRRRGGLRR